MTYALRSGDRTTTHNGLKTLASHALLTGWKDLARAGKPIIHLSASEPDTFVAFMADHPMMLRINTQTIGPEAADALGKFIADFQNQHLSREAVSIRIKPYQTAPIADAYLKLLENQAF